MRVAISGSSTQSGWISVERRHRVDHVALLLARDAVGVAQVEDRVALGAEVDALEAAGQEAAVPLPGGDRLHLAAAPVRGQHDEAGQVVGLAAEAVPDPRAHARPAGDLACRCS